jgi:hypothetical protein
MANPGRRQRRLQERERRRRDGKQINAVGMRRADYISWGSRRRWRSPPR